VAVSAAENILVWDIKTGEKLMTLSSGAKHEVSCLAISNSGNEIFFSHTFTGLKMLSNIGEKLAAGYEDGTIRIFELDSGED